MDREDTNQKLNTGNADAEKAGQTEKNEHNENTAAASAADETSKPETAEEVLVDPADNERRKLAFMQGPARAITYGVIVGIVLLVSILIIVGSSRWRYHSYRVISSRRQEDTMSASYCDVDENILRYGTDGASLARRTGDNLWDVNYTMTDPAVVTCGKTIAIYDRSGSDIVVCNEQGSIGTISTRLPVIKADVSSDGNVAVIEEDASNAYIEYYRANGSQIAEIRTSMDNPGYPLDLGLSRDGEMIAVSYLNVADQSQKAVIHVYNFGEPGQNQMDNRVGEFEYNGRLVPEIDYLDGSTFVAFFDNGFRIFSGDRVPAEQAAVTVDGEIASVFHSDEYIGLVVKENGASYLQVYNRNGQRITNQSFDFLYTTLDFTGDAVTFYNGADFCVYNISGVLKFDGTCDGSMKQIFAIGKHRYVVVRENSVDMIQLQ